MPVSGAMDTPREDGRGDPAVQGVHVLVAAQRQADKVISDAEACRDRMLARARADAARVQAEQDAARLLAEIRARAPLEAQARYAYCRALGEAFSAQLAAALELMEAAGAVPGIQGEPETLG